MNLFKALGSIKRLFIFKDKTSFPGEWDRETRKQVERIVGCRIKDSRILQQAFRHASYPSCSQDNGLPSNERLEFLGDAVLDLIMREFLYLRYPLKNEGALTKIRSVLASKPVLAQKAKELDLGAFLLLSPGEEKSGGRQKDSILANTLESLIGALYLDVGLTPVRGFVLKIFSGSWESLPRESQRRNFKGDLLEYCQKEYKRVPSYRLTKQEGAEHRRRYTIEVRVMGKRWGVGKGYSKKQAEQRAAERALKKIPYGT